MWLRSLGALSVAVLFTNGLAFGQDAGSAPAGGSSSSGSGSSAFDWLSPAPLAWAQPGFNWEDMPARLYLSEYSGYNSNIFNAYPGTPLPKGVLLGDTFVKTDVGATTKLDIEGQVLFGKADFATTNYTHDLSIDLHNHLLTGGVNWNAASHCTGTLTLLDGSSEAPQNEQVGPGIDILTTNSITDSAQCHIYQDINLIFNSGATSTRHSLITAQSLDNNTLTTQAGIQYAWQSLDNIEFTLGYTDTTYTDRIASTQSGLPNSVNLVNYQVTYNNTFSEKLNFSLMGGLTQDVTAGGGNPSAQPIYSLTLNYQATSKFGIALTATHTVAPPTSIIAATQINNTESLGLTYALTPKITLMASLGSTTTEGSGSTTQANGALFGANKLESASLRANYLLTPFTSLAASYVNSDRTSVGSPRLSTNLFMFGLDYRPL